MALITYLTTVRFGFGVLAELPEDLAALGMERPLIVTDRGIAAAGLLERLDAVLGTRPRSVFDEVPPNPTEEAALRALDQYRSEGCHGLIGFGGGSPIDLAKAVALLAAHPGPLAQYAMIEGGLARITDEVAPVIAIPTTAGTGSEVGRGSLINLSDGRKVGLISPHLIPKRAICDPELTLVLPPRLTAATGMDALSHCIETFLSPRFNPPADAIALDGAGRIVRHLERAVENGADREARAELMMGALEGGLTFQKGLGAVHGAVARLRFAEGALAASRDAQRRSPAAGAALQREPRRRQVRAPGRCHGAGGRHGSGSLCRGPQCSHWLAGVAARHGRARLFLPEMALKAERDHSTATNPRPTTAADYAALLEDSIAA